MAKIIKYKFLSCEVPYTETVKVPLLDENGEPVMQEIVTVVIDENGEEVVKTSYEPVMIDEVRHGVEQIILDKGITCKTQSDFDSAYPIAEKEAYGEITVEGEFESVYDTAPRNILAGEYITINGVLYLALENIPGGEMIIVGQNAIETTVEQQLYEMKGE